MEKILHGNLLPMKRKKLKMVIFCLILFLSLSLFRIPLIRNLHGLGENCIHFRGDIFVAGSNSSGDKLDICSYIDASRKEGLTTLVVNICFLKIIFWCLKPSRCVHVGCS